MKVDKQSRLVSRNVSVGGQRTSMRHEPEVWESLEEICRREGMTHRDLITRIAQTHPAEMLSSAVSTYVLAYFRSAATEAGHKAAGHGIVD